MATGHNGHRAKVDSDFAATPKICIVGAGFGGLLAAIQLKRKLGITTFTILDKNQDVGGLWLTSKYPGVCADLPAHMYCYTFEINYDSNKLYPDQPQQWQYFRRLALKYKLYNQVRFGTTVSALTWTGRKWIVRSHLNSTGGDGHSCKIDDELIEEYDMVIMAKGALHQINFPDQFKSFNGPVIHSADWDGNIRLENKVVGIVGSSSSAAQIIPAIAPVVKKLICYQRSAPYVGPKFQMHIPAWLNFIFRWIPGLVWLELALYWLVAELLAVGCTCSRTLMNSVVHWLTPIWLKWNIKDRKLREGLTPKYKVWTRIPIVSNTFYKAMTLKNVQLEKAAIRKVEGNSIVTEDGNKEKMDVLILCTGYKLQDYFAPMKVTGTAGQDLLKLWKQGRPKTYYGTTCSAAPNLFILSGPNTLQFGGFVFGMECQMNIVINILKYMNKMNVNVFHVKEEAEEECVRELERRIANSIWDGASKDATWFVNEQGHQTVLWPGTATSFWWKTRKFDPNKFEFEIKNSEFSNV